MKKNFLKLFESELSKAEVTLAVKDISDRLQKMASDISKINVDDIPSVIERIKVSHGVEEGNDFGKLVSDELNQLIENVLEVKSKIDDRSLVLSGDATEQDVDMPNDMEKFDNEDENDTDTSDDVENDDKDDEDLFKMDKKDEKPTLGRKVKSGIKNESVNRLLEKIKSSKKKKVVTEMYKAGGDKRKKVIELAKSVK